jgi:O-antigen ligase
VATVAVAAAYVAVAASGGGYSATFQAGAALLVWWLVALGLLTRWLPLGPVPGAALAAGLCLAGYALMAGLSAAWASDDGATFTELTRGLSYLGTFALVVLLSARLGARPWLNGLAIGLVAVAALALGSRLEPSWFPNQELGVFLPAARARLSYPVNYWNGLGACMAGAVVLLTWLGAAARTRPGRAAAVGLLPIPIVVIFLTSSRGGAAAAAFGLVVLLVAAPGRVQALAGALVGGAGGAALVALTAARSSIVDGRLGTPAADHQGHQLLVASLVTVLVAAGVRALVDRPVGLIRLPVPSRRVLLAGAAAALAAVAIAVGALASSGRFDRFTKPPSGAAQPQAGLVTSHFTSDSGSGRYQFWQSAWKAFEEQPVHGIGAGAYESWWARTATISYAIRDAHSWFVESLAELGIVGGLLALGFVLSGAAAGIRRRLAAARSAPELGGALALLAAGTLSAAIDWTWELPAAFLLLLVAVALLTGPATGDREAGPTRGGRLWWTGTVLVSAIGIVVGVMALVTQVKLGDSRDAARRGDLVEAGHAADAAIAVQPWAAAPRLQRALVDERAGDLKGALSAGNDAIQRAPDDWRLWITAARFRTKAGDVPGAERALEKARTLNPRAQTLAREPR